MYLDKWIDSLLLALDKSAISGRNNSQVAQSLAAIADLLGCAAGFDDGVRISGPASNKEWVPSLHLLEVYEHCYKHFWKKKIYIHVKSDYLLFFFFFNL